MRTIRSRPAKGAIAETRGPRVALFSVFEDAIAANGRQRRRRRHGSLVANTRVADPITGTSVRTHGRAIENRARNTESRAVADVQVYSKGARGYRDGPRD